MLAAHNCLDAFEPLRYREPPFCFPHSQTLPQYADLLEVWRKISELMSSCILSLKCTVSYKSDFPGKTNQHGSLVELEVGANMYGASSGSQALW